MAQLTQYDLATGFQCVLDQRWQDLRIWMAARDMPIDHDEVCRIMRLCMLANDTEKAYKMFCAAFEGMDPEGTRAARRFLGRGCVVVSMLVALGTFGGILALVKAVFW